MRIINFIKPRGLVQSFLKSLNGERIAEDFNKLSLKGKFWFAFDGVDEVPTEYRENFSKSILDFVYSNRFCKYFVSSRFSVPNILDSGFLKISINPFNENQITEFTYHKLHASNMWRSFLERIKEEPEIEDIVGNPLALGFLLSRYLRKEHTPHLMTEVLSDILYLFTDQWDSRRGIVRSLTRVLSSKIIFRILSRIAGQLDKNNDSQFDDAYVKTTLQSILDEDKGRNLLEEIAANTSLIRMNSSGYWQFTHRCVQEYLSAVNKVDELSDHTKDTFYILRHSKSDAVSRSLRYLLGTASDATNIVSKASDDLDLHMNENIVLCRLNYALSERVAVEPTVAERYSNLVSNALESATKNLINLKIEAYPKEEVCFRISGKADNEQQAVEYINLLKSIRSLRDGSIGKKVLLSIQKSNQKQTSKLSYLIIYDGVIRSNIDLKDEAIMFSIELVRLRMDIN